MKRKASKRPAVKLLDAAMIELADGIRESLDAFRERVEIFTVARGRAGPSRPLTQGRDMSGKKAGSVFDISALFEQELQARNEDLRRQAALSMLPKLRPSARVTMAEFLDSLQQHREVWSAVLTMSAVEFASLIAGSPRRRSDEGCAGTDRSARGFLMRRRTR
jgi:hypothetical protein